jgi:hypothetical protein
MSRFSAFVIGLLGGIYLDQSHTMPNIERWVNYGIQTVKDWEKKHRK